MRIKFFIAVVFAFVGLQHVVHAQESEDIFTIYLVRHAEKEVAADTPRNPSLTKCGAQRAASLSSFLENVPLDAIYTTDYIRTKSTAQPTATKKKMEFKLYNPRELSEFSKLLLERKEDALVVGHSNTTGVLAGLLINEKIAAFDESIYNRIYQIVIHKNTGRLHILQSTFTCGKEE